MAQATADPIAADSFAELGVTAEEVGQLLAAIRASNAAKAADDEKRERQRTTGYPKVLYNPMFLGESVLVTKIETGPDGEPRTVGTSRRLAFNRGRIEVHSAEDEALIRAQCPGRIYEKDMPEEKLCDRCSRFVSGSWAATRRHDELMHMP